MTELARRDDTALLGAVVVDQDLDDPLPRLLAGWLLDYRSVHTRRAYASDARGWLAWCAAHDVQPLAAGRAHFAAWARQMEAEGKSADTVARRLAAMSSFYAWLLEEDHLGANPVAAVRRPTLNPDVSTTAWLNPSQINALLDAAYTDPRPTRARTKVIITLLLFNGLRVGELVGLNLDDLDEQDNHRIIRVHGKGDRIRVGALAPATAAAVDDYLAERAAAAGTDLIVGGPPGQPSPLLITSTGRRLATSTVFRLVRRLLRSAAATARREGRPAEDLERLAGRAGVHSLRHTAITTLLNLGVSLRDAQAFAGHADSRQTGRYDRDAHNLDRHGAYVIAANFAGGRR